MQIRDTMSPGPGLPIAEASVLRRRYLSPQVPDPLAALAAIAERADLIIVEGQAWLLCPANQPLLDQLAALDAYREDLEEDDPAEHEEDGFTNPMGESRRHPLAGDAQS